MGVAPSTRADGGAFLAREIARDLLEQLRSGEMPKARYLFADQILTGDALAVSRGHPFQALRPRFSRLADDDHEAATVIVVDTAKLLRRLLSRLRTLLGDVPDPLARTYSTVIVAAVAGTNPSTVRAWLARHLLELKS